MSRRQRRFLSTTSPDVFGNCVGRPSFPRRFPRNAELGRYFASHGYAVVMQDVRGRYKSDGTWRMLTDDGRDGQDVCNWIAKQPWSNGKIGTIGTSYEGGTQHALAMEHCPALVTTI